MVTEAPKPRSPRQRAHARPLPAGWRPIVGAPVWLPPRYPFRRSAIGIVERLYGMPLDDVARVRYSVHGYRRTVQILIAELRPVRLRRKRRRG